MSAKNRLLKPYRNYAPHDVIGEFRTNYTGDAGLFVKVVTNDPDDDVYFTNDKVGADYDGVYNNLFQSPKIVGKAGAGDPAAAILGITVQGTASEDAHGNKINGFNERWAAENNYVPTGKPVQIVTRGLFEVSTDIINGTPAPGSGVIVGANGTYTVADPDNLVVTETGKLLVGKFLSTASTRQNSATVLLNL